MSSPNPPAAFAALVDGSIVIEGFRRVVTVSAAEVATEKLYDQEWMGPRPLDCPICKAPALFLTHVRALRTSAVSVETYECAECGHVETEAID